jgi:hypothetical protein
MSTSASNLDPKFLISLAATLALQAAGIVWWASSLHSDVQHNDFQIQMLAKDVEKHSIFVRDWPAGKWGSGSLPDDVKQNLKIGMLENDMDKVMSKLYNGHHSPTAP